MERPLSDRDPGWRPVLGSLHYGFVPHLALWGARRRKLDGLSALRLFVVSFPVSLGMILWVVLSLDLTAESGFSATTAMLMVGGLAVWSYGGLALVLRQAAKVETDAEAAGHFRVRSFLILAFSNAIALVGFVLVFLSESAAPFYLGLSLAVPGIYWAVPTRAAIERHQGNLGYEFELIDALVRQTPPTLRRFGG